MHIPACSSRPMRDHASSNRWPLARVPFLIAYEIVACVHPKASPASRCESKTSPVSTQRTRIPRPPAAALRRFLGPEGAGFPSSYAHESPPAFFDASRSASLMPDWPTPVRLYASAADA